MGYDGVAWRADPLDAARVYWLDAFTANIDRTWRNPNLLVWHRRLWLIDHGASLYFHHAWSGWREASRRPFATVHDHVLLPFAGAVPEADAALGPLLTPETLAEVLAAIPDEWLDGEPGFRGVDEVRSAYAEFLSARLEEPRGWARDLQEAHETAV